MPLPIRIGDVVLCDRALRDEGVSYFYAFAALNLLFDAAAGALGVRERT